MHVEILLSFSFRKREIALNAKLRGTFPTYLYYSSLGGGVCSSENWRNQSSHPTQKPSQRQHFFYFKEALQLSFIPVSLVIYPDWCELSPSQKLRRLIRRIGRSAPT